MTITKEATRLSAKREAFRLAAERCEYYLNHVIPALHTLDCAIKDKGITLLEKTKVKIEGNSIQTESSATNEDLDDLISIGVEIATAFNTLEGFAIFFTTGVADERVGFASVGHTFCNSVRKYTPILALLFDDGKHYQQIRQLFCLWNSRIDSIELSKAKENVEERLRKINERAIVPIGTE